MDERVEKLAAIIQTVPMSPMSTEPERIAKAILEAGYRLPVLTLISDEERPKIVCLCGSSRFIWHFAVMAWELEKQGCITLGLHLLPENYTTEKVHVDHIAEWEGVAAQMDKLHRRKIDLADEVFVLNVGGYIGESTRNEINYASSKGKPIRYLEAQLAHSKKELGIT